LAPDQGSVVERGISPTTGEESGDPEAGEAKEKRNLGIPCVLDRFIQQAMLQVLQSQWDGTFSESSYGFRPGRSAHQANAKAQGYLRSGYARVVDLDLESFFDRVNHDRLMSRRAARIADQRVLKLIRGYLQAGILEGGLVRVLTEGTPQGGPPSPFLSNVVLDEWDKEMGRRGHRFVRYGDDCNIYVKSRRAGVPYQSERHPFHYPAAEAAGQRSEECSRCAACAPIPRFHLYGRAVTESTQGRSGIATAVSGSNTSVDPASLEHQHGGAGASAHDLPDGLARVLRLL